MPTNHFAAALGPLASPNRSALPLISPSPMDRPPKPTLAPAHGP